LSKQIRSLRQTIQRALGLHSESKAAMLFREILEDQRRRPQIDVYNYSGTNYIIPPPTNDPAQFVMLSLSNEVLRTIHEAIIREVLRILDAETLVHEKFNCKCKVCGAVYQNPKTACDAPDCENTSEWIYPSQDQKKLLQAFVDQPNPDDGFKKICESLLRYMLSTNDYWLSVQKAESKSLAPFTVFVEDAIYMRVVSSTYGRIGNGEYFCPVCTKANPTASFPRGQRCPHHPAVEPLETAYVYAEGDAVKARFAKAELFHDMVSPWLPGFYGNPHILSILRTVLSITALDKKNLDEYNTGWVKQILVASGMSQDAANKMVADAMKQDMYKVEVNPLTGEKVVKDKALVLGVGAGDLKAIQGMPDTEKMKSLDWWKLWKTVCCSVYGVQDVFTGTVEAGTTGQNPRMKVDVNNNTTEFYLHKLEDMFNTFVLPKLGVFDWKLEGDVVEEKDDMQDITVLNAKLDAVKKAVDLGLEAELTDEGDVKISGVPLSLEDKQAMQLERLEKQAQANPNPAPQEGNAGAFRKEAPFSTEKAGKVKSQFLVTEYEKHD